MSKRQCQYNDRRLPAAWIETVMNKVNNPTGKWSDFNNIHKYWISLRKFTDDIRGMFCESDVPADGSDDSEPQPSDYNLMANIILTFKIGTHPVADLINILENRNNNGINYVLLKTMHRLDDELAGSPDAWTHESISICRSFNVSTIWCRWLWPGYGEFARESLYDADWYSQELLALEDERQLSGSTYSCFDVEVYGNNILLTEDGILVHTIMDAEEYADISSATRTAGINVGKCDYTWPASYRSFQFVEPFNNFLSKKTIGQQMYNLTWKRMEQMPSDIFMAITGEVEEVSSPKFDTLELLTKYRDLWKSSDGVIMYPDSATDWDLTTAALIAMA